MNKKKIIEIAVLSAVFLLMIVLRVGLGSFKEFNKAEKYYSNGETDFAVIHYDRSIHWYTPVNPFVNKSVKKLGKIARDYEAKKELKNAVETYEVLRSAIYSTRSFYTPFKDVIDSSDEKIASLRAEIIKNDPSWDNLSERPSKAEILADLKKDTAPSVLFSVMASVGFLGWIASVIFFILGVLPKEEFPRKKGFIIGVLFFVFYLIWLIGLAKA